MKRLLTLLPLILICLLSFADGGKYFRYELKIKLQDNSEITGYVYIGSYNPEYISGNESFFEYAKREISFPLEIYSEIKTVEINNEFQLDFSTEEYSQKIQAENISKIGLLFA